MGHKRSRKHAQPWAQLDLLDGGHGVGARQPGSAAQPGGGGYLNVCTPPEVAKGIEKKIAKNFRFPQTEKFGQAAVDPREMALLDELEAMGLSRVMLQIAHAIGVDHFMAMWQILDSSYEAMMDNDSGIYIRLQRLSAYRRYQRNRFIEAMAAMGKSQPEISRMVKRELGESMTDRHIFRLMSKGKVPA